MDEIYNLMNNLCQIHELKYYNISDENLNFKPSRYIQIGSNDLLQKKIIVKCPSILS